MGTSSKYKFNIHQRKWIDRLKSGKTKKAVGTLEEEDKNGCTTRCCLGEAVYVLRDIFPENLPMYGDELEESYKNVMEKLHLRNGEGGIRTELISEKWKLILENEYGFDLSKGKFIGLAALNDGDFRCGTERKEMSHEEIGKFIEENPRAVFMK